MNEILYLVGRVNKVIEGQLDWEYVGIFEKNEDAESSCKDFRYFIGPVELNVDVDDKYGTDPKEWPGCYYPNPNFPEGFANLTKETDLE